MRRLLIKIKDKRKRTKVKNLLWALPIILIVSCSQIKEAPKKVAFLGDSQVRNWDLDYWFPFNRNTNYGIPGYRASDLVNDIDETEPADKIIVWIGINDIIQLSQAYGSQTTIDSVLNSFRLLTEYLGPDDLLLSVCPVTQEFDDLYVQDLNNIVSEVNRGIVTICSETDIQIIDINEPVSEGGRLNTAFTQDGIHLNNSGYEVISKEIRPYIY